MVSALTELINTKFMPDKIILLEHQVSTAACATLSKHAAHV